MRDIVTQELTDATNCDLWESVAFPFDHVTHNSHASILAGTGIGRVLGYAKSTAPALALCIAALKARETKP